VYLASNSVMLFERSSPFGGIPRNWKQNQWSLVHSTGRSSPFGGIPRNWKRSQSGTSLIREKRVPPSGGSLEIGNHPAQWPY